MFYQENQIKTILKCSYCVESFRIKDCIKCLPCGQAICLDCEMKIEMKIEIKNLVRKFNCWACKADHNFPENGLPNHLGFMKLNDLNSQKISRGPNADKLNHLLDELMTSLDELRYIHNIGTINMIKQECENINNQIEINYISQVDWLEKLKQEQINTVTNYQNELLANSNSVESADINSSTIATLENQVTTFCINTHDYLVETVELNENEIGNAIENVKCFKEKLKIVENKLRSTIFNGRIITLEENHKFIDSKHHLGNIVFKEIRSDIQPRKDFYNLQ